MEDRRSKDGTDERVGRLRALIGREPVADRGLAGTARYLHALCRVAARIP